MSNIFTSISLDKTKSTSLYIQLYEILKTKIEEGALVSDTKLPSIRDISKDLGVNTVTVISALKKLEQDNYIFTKTGKGKYISRISSFLSSEKLKSNNLISDEIYNQDDLFFISKTQITINDATINFASATPNPDLFPVDDFKTVINKLLDRDKGNAFGYQESQGYLLLRESVTKLLHEENIHCTTDNIQVISGAQQGIDVISKAILNQGDFVLTESPTYTGAIAVFKSRGAEIIDIELEEDGPNISILEYSIKKYKPKLFYTIPTYQNPTGYSYSNAKRMEVLRLARKYNFLIIEDDYVSSLFYENEKHTSLKALDESQHVIHIKSFSKIFMPGLRLGFLIFPSRFLDHILVAKHTTDISTSGLIQRAFDLYIREGFWEKHSSYMCNIYKERYFEMTKVLDDKLPKGFSYKKPGGGLNIWLNLPFGFPTSELMKQAYLSNIVFTPGSIFYSSNSLEKYNNLRLSFAAVYKNQIDSGVEKLCEIIEKLSIKNIGINMPML